MQLRSFVANANIHYFSLRASFRFLSYDVGALKSCLDRVSRVVIDWLFLLVCLNKD